MRIVLHAGFHKTGTTTVQKTLVANEKLLAPHVRVYLRPQMTPLCEAARAFSASRDPLDLAGVHYEAAELFGQIDLDDPRPMLLASEDLAGHMPGRRGLTSYDATPAIMRALVETAGQVLPAPDMAFHFSTRAPAAWLRSCHTQHLRATRMTMEAGDYAAKFRESAKLEAIVAGVRAAVAPHTVTSAALEDIADTPFGPLSPLLALLDLPGTVLQQLELLPPANVSIPRSLRDEYLALNRSGLTGRALHEAKKAARRRVKKNRA